MNLLSFQCVAWQQLQTKAVTEQQLLTDVHYILMLLSVFLFHLFTSVVCLQFRNYIWVMLGCLDPREFAYSDASCVLKNEWVFFMSAECECIFMKADPKRRLGVFTLSGSIVNLGRNSKNECEGMAVVCRDWEVLCISC